MKSRILTGLLLIAAAIVSGLNCDIVFRLHRPDLPNRTFAGCFKGPVSQPGGAGDVTVVFEIPPSDSSNRLLVGCIVGQDPTTNATFSGSVDEDNKSRATVNGVTAGGAQPFTLLVQRVPSGPSDAATSVTVRTADGAFLAPGLPACTPQRSCFDLGVAQ